MKIKSFWKIIFWKNKISPLLKPPEKDFQSKSIKLNCYAKLRSEIVFLFNIAASRVLFATWWIFVQVLTSFYTAELTAFLTLVDSTLPVKNLDDLRDRAGAKWVGIAGGTFQTIVEVCVVTLRLDFIRMVTEVVTLLLIT